MSLQSLNILKQKSRGGGGGGVEVWARNGFNDGATVVSNYALPWLGEMPPKGYHPCRELESYTHNMSNMGVSQ